MYHESNHLYKTLTIKYNNFIPLAKDFRKFVKTFDPDLLSFVSDDTSNSCMWH